MAATIPEALQIAIQHHQAGRLQAAEQIYRQILAVEPNHAHALHLLGVIAHQLGQHELAVQHIEQAIRANGTVAAFHNNLGLAQQSLGRLDDAAACYRRALELNPNYAEAHYNLANVLKDRKKLDEAVACYRRALALKPDFAEAYNNLGIALKDQGKPDEAIACHRRVLELKPSDAGAHYNLGNALRDRRELDQAVACYRRAIQLNPEYAEAHNNLGNAFNDQGNLDDAIACYRRALQLKPNYADAHNNLGNAFKDQGKSDDAIACYRRAIALKPEFAEAHNSLGIVFQNQQNLDDAIACHRRALEITPGYAEAHNNLGVALQNQGKLDEAAACYRRALELNPDYAEAHNSLGNAFRDQRKLDEAIACYRRALELKPDYADAHYNLGNALEGQGKLDDAIASYHRALELKPDFAEAHSGLGGALRGHGRLEEAIACHRRALELKSDYVVAHNNLGGALKDQGKLEEALACYRRAVELKPDDAGPRSNLLFVLQYCPGVTPAALAEAHAEFDRLHAAPLGGAAARHENDRDRRRPLRLGFVSPDLGRHPVGYFLVRVLENLNREQCVTICYSDRSVKDDLTHRFQAAATQWRDTVSMSDERLAEQIRADRIDILFDLAGHTAHNRLLVFARKPVPIQVTWAGYVGTTGVTAMDYLLADRYEVPPGAERHYREQVLRMPEGYVCYDPPDYAPAVAPLPALSSGQVTFGCFNNTAKVAAQAVEVWGKILRRLPGARLVLRYKGWNDSGVVRRFTELFAAQAINPGRLEFLGLSPHAELLAEYNRIDLALDPFPYSGGLTTCEALWMGVPVITCPGETFASRHSLSHLSNVGLTETVARDLNEYVELAVSLANDLPRLSTLRAGLRERMAASPLCDGKRFAANLLALLRQIWQEWCEQYKAES